MLERLDPIGIGFVDGSPGLGPRNVQRKVLLLRGFIVPGIFISYRRADTIAWAGHVFADLRKHFGAVQVFMDINDGIPRGADFAQVLNDRLASCDALLALIGPGWLDCTRADGTRRLDAEDDWVRNEIATALRRNILVVPVLFGDARRPAASALPDDLRALTRRQEAVISDQRWDYDVAALIGDLTSAVPSMSPAEQQVTSASTGLQLLKDLIATTPAVADALARSREVIANTYAQIRKLEVFKAVHDGLHNIEFECLRPMQAGGASTRLRPFRIKYVAEAALIADCLKQYDMNAALREDILEQLDYTGNALQAAVDHPGAASFAEAVGDLNVLLSGLPPRLDAGIADAAAEINLQRLVALMEAVRAQLPEDNAAYGPELDPFVSGIDALRQLCDQLSGRVAEHNQLQRLDSKLRTVCVAGSGVATIASEWRRIRSIRQRLQPPFFSPLLDSARKDLEAIETDIDAAVARGDEQSSGDLLQEYFFAVATVFRGVDTGLRDFCVRLSEVSKPLQTVLAMI